ncbi:VRR-NUC domain-containing protein [Chloroflexota bacterium]
MSEHSEQVAIFQWAELQKGAMPELALLFAIPNGAKLPWRRNKRGKRYSPEATRLKAEGLKSGVPDICLPVPRAGWHGLFIELKVGKNKPTTEQETWLDRLFEQGYCAVVCYGSDDAINFITRYLEATIEH